MTHNDVYTYTPKGAKPDLATKIENASRRVEDAEAEARSAQHRVEWSRRELAELEAEARA